MDLKEIVFKLVEDLGISKSELIIEEIDDFIKEHGTHGGYNINLNYLNEILTNITLKCEANRLKEHTECSHWNLETIP